MNMMSPYSGYYGIMPPQYQGYGAGYYGIPQTLPWQGATPYMAAQQPASEIGPPLPGRLMNGSTGYFQQAANQNRTQLDIYLPISSVNAAARGLAADLLLGGSEATKAYMNQCSTRGIEAVAGPAGDKFVLSLSGPKGQEAELLQVAMNVLTRPQVDRQTFNKLKDDNIRELQKLESEPEIPLQEAMQKRFYGANHPYARNRREVIAEVSAETLESVMSVFRQGLQNTGQAKVMMVSPLPVQEQQALLNQGIQQYSWYPDPYRPGALAMPPPVAARRGAEGPILVANENLPRAHIVQTFRAPAVGDPDFPAFTLLTEMLRGMSGAFFKVLRTEKGLVYGTHQSYTNKKGNGSSYSVSAQVNYDKINPALEGMHKVIQDTINNPVDDADLRMAKKQYILNLRDAMQSSTGISSLNDSLLANDLNPLHPDVLKAAIERVSAADIQRVANRVFKPATGYQLIGISAPQHVLQTFVKSQSRSQRG